MACPQRQREPEAGWGTGVPDSTRSLSRPRSWGRACGLGEFQGLLVWKQPEEEVGEKKEKQDYVAGTTLRPRNGDCPYAPRVTAEEPEPCALTPVLQTPATPSPGKTRPDPSQFAEPQRTPRELFLTPDLNLFCCFKRSLSWASVAVASPRDHDLGGLETPHGP